jgi:hypothetical protein
MMKLGVAILGLMTVPLFAWLLVPALMVIAVLSPFLLALGVFMVASLPPRHAVKAAPADAEHALPEPELATPTA